MAKIHPKNWKNKVLDTDMDDVVTHVHRPRNRHQFILVEPVEQERDFHYARYDEHYRTAHSSTFTRLGQTKASAGTSFADALMFLTAAVPAQYRHLDHTVTVHPSAVASWVPEAPSTDYF